MTNNEKIISKLKKMDLSVPKNLQMLFDMAVVTEDKELILDIRSRSAKYGIDMASVDMEKAVDFREIYKKTLLYMAKDDFDSYLQYLEWNRPAHEKFYMPRRKVMKQLVEALQDLTDDKLDELFLSCPPRTGKTSILMFYVTWIIGKRSETSNLYSAFSDTITSAFYQGVLEITTDPVTYLWGDVFSSAVVAGTNAKEETLNIDRRKRYPTLTCRSLYGTLNGACDCNGILISDDLIGGIEEALNKDRMMNAWSKVDNNLIPRSKEKAKILWCGTRWSNVDPAGLRMELLQNDEKFAKRRIKIINLPALDENDESNFDYDYGVGFSTEFYQQRRASFERNKDMASWFAQYMGEPIEREGALFSPQELRYYNGILPEIEPDRIFMAVDPAWGGGDFVSAPICYQYGIDVYVVDVVYDNGDKKITQKLIADKILEHKVQAIQFEANKATMSYKEGVEERLKSAGYKANMITKSAPTGQNKFQRIFDKAPDIRETMIFLENGKRSKEYSLFMQNVFSYKMFGKNKNDDAPDSLSMAIGMIRNQINAVKIINRIF
ncbi:MAG: phage terminase large subunit [Oscillospiraceae bacterium]